MGLRGVTRSLGEVREDRGSIATHDRLLAERLGRPATVHPVSWVNGGRCPSRERRKKLGKRVIKKNKKLII
jgi:hypothetical protein